jgi:hypothetical protein
MNRRRRQRQGEAEEARLQAEMEAAFEESEDPKSRSVGEGFRHQALVQYAGRLANRGLGEDEILHLLERFNDDRCDPPKEESEIRRIAQSASRWESRVDPRRVDLTQLIIRNDMSAVATEALAIVECWLDNGLFVRGGRLVRFRRDGSVRRFGIAIPDGTPAIQEIDSAALRELIDYAANCVAPGPGGKLRPTLPPRWLADTILSRGEWPMFPPLRGIVEAPTLRPDGTIFEVPGYDWKTGLWFDPGGTIFPSAPEQPTRREAIEALRALVEPFAEFAYVSDGDRLVVLAAILSLVGRAMIDGPCPAFAFRAPTPGSGKSLQADALSIIGTGRPAARMSAARDEEESRKRITSLAMEGVSAVCVDNVSGSFASDALAAALTGTSWQDRILGGNTIRTLPLTAVWLITGNNVTFGGDLGRRVLVSDIDAKVEHPEDRTGFKYPDLRSHVLRRRPSLVKAALTVLRRFVVAGKPGHGLPPKGSFEAWDAVVRGALLWAGAGDALATTRRIREEGDSDLEALRAGLAAWKSAFKGEAVSAAAAISRANKSRELESALAVFAGCPESALDARRLGYALRRFRGRLAGGLMFDGARNAHTGTVQWRVVGGDGGNGGDAAPRNCDGEPVDLPYLNVKRRGTSPPSPPSPPKAPRKVKVVRIPKRGRGDR